MKTFGLVIVGAGAGRFAAAIRTNELKAKTALINEGLPLCGIVSKSAAYHQRDCSGPVRSCISQIIQNFWNGG